MSDFQLTAVWFYLFILVTKWNIYVYILIEQTKDFLTVLGSSHFSLINVAGLYEVYKEIKKT